METQDPCGHVDMKMPLVWSCRREWWLPHPQPFLFQDPPPPAHFHRVSWIRRWPWWRAAVPKRRLRRRKRRASWNCARACKPRERMPLRWKRSPMRSFRPRRGRSRRTWSGRPGSRRRARRSPISRKETTARPWPKSRATRRSRRGRGIPGVCHGNDVDFHGGSSILFDMFTRGWSFI